MAEEKKNPGSAVVWKDRKHFLWFPFSFTRYSITNGRVYVEKGLLNTTSDQTLLYRITDIQMKRSLGQKMCGTGTIILISSVDAESRVYLENIKKPKEVYTMISNLVEESRAQKNVIGKEFYARGGHGFEQGPGMMPPPPVMGDPAMFPDDDLTD